LVRRVVVDASLSVDLFVGRDPVRVRVAEFFFKLVQDGVIRAYAPRLFLVETAGVTVRFIPRSLAEEAVGKLARLVTIVPDDAFYREAEEAALSTGSRGADAYYIGLARVLNAPLVTNDKTQATNAKRAGVKAFYLIEEVEDFREFLRTTIFNRGDH